MAVVLQTDSIIDGIASNALDTGHFERVNRHAAESSPGTGLTGNIVVTTIKPVAKVSGLAVSSALLALSLRIHSNLHTEPRDQIDVTIANALDALFQNYCGGFTLGGLLYEIDVDGEHGIPMAAPFGYLQLDGATYRCATLSIPCVIADVWGQAT